jgi:hypothetical protein
MLTHIQPWFLAEISASLSCTLQINMFEIIHLHKDTRASIGIIAESILPALAIAELIRDGCHWHMGGMFRHGITRD